MQTITRWTFITASLFLAATAIDSCDGEPCDLAGGSTTGWQLVNLTVGPPAAYFAMFLILILYLMWRRLMSHTKLYQQGKITKTEYENAEYLKATNQKGLYKMYEKKLDERAKQAEQNRKDFEEMAKHAPLGSHIRRAEDTP